MSQHDSAAVITTSQFQCPWFNPELKLLSVLSFTCSPCSQASFFWIHHFPFTTQNHACRLATGYAKFPYRGGWVCACAWCHVMDWCPIQSVTPSVFRMGSGCSATLSNAVTEHEWMMTVLQKWSTSFTSTSSNRQLIWRKIWFFGFINSSNTVKIQTFYV